MDEIRKERYVRQNKVVERIVVPSYIQDNIIEKIYNKFNQQSLYYNKDRIKKDIKELIDELLEKEMKLRLSVVERRMKNLNEEMILLKETLKANNIE